MIFDLMVKFIIKILELYSSWIPDWNPPDALVEALTSLIYYGRFIGILINTEALYGATIMFLELLMIMVLIKQAEKLIKLIRG
jgi:hypothetical protein